MQNQSSTQEIKQYRIIFICLIALTAISVGIHYMNLSTTLSIILILSIATLQATLSICYFMHLISEKKIIFLVLILTVCFFIGMVGLTLHSHFNHPEGSLYVH